MSKINEKFIKNISEVDILKFYGEELVSLFDYEQYGLSKEQLRLQAKAVVTNFIEQLVECMKP